MHSYRPKLGNSTPTTLLSRTSRNDLADRLDRFDTNEFLVKAAVEVGESVRVEAHLLQDRGVEALHMERLFEGGGSNVVGRADAYAPFQATAGHPHRETV